MALLTLFTLLIMLSCIPALAFAQRVAGPDLFQTAAQVSQANWDTAGTVVIARSDAFPDALAGTPLAYRHDAPILLTNPGALHHSARVEVQRLRARKAVILGGTAAVSATVEEQLKGLGLSVERIGGADRYETAALVAQELGPADKAVIAYGENFPDALAIGPYAARNGYPILLTRTDTLPGVTRGALKNIKSTIVVGGTAVIGPAVYGQLPSPLRAAGEDRYATAADIVRKLYPAVSKAYVATGLEFPYALVGSVPAAKGGVPMLLVRPQSVPGPTRAVIQEKGIKDFVILGDRGVISEAVEQELRAGAPVEPAGVKLSALGSNGYAVEDMLVAFGGPYALYLDRAALSSHLGQGVTTADRLIVRLGGKEWIAEVNPRDRGQFVAQVPAGDIQGKADLKEAVVSLR